MPVGITTTVLLQMSLGLVAELPPWKRCLSTKLCCLISLFYCFCLFFIWQICQLFIVLIFICVLICVCFRRTKGKIGLRIKFLVLFSVRLHLFRITSSNVCGLHLSAFGFVFLWFICGLVQTFDSTQPNEDEGFLFQQKAAKPTCSSYRHSSGLVLVSSLCLPCHPK